jgi:NAD(P)-dependent dehydrogenase (short-subunit alcohol dehydrogenase family)
MNYDEEFLTPNLKDINVLLTGGNQGLGETLAKELVKSQANLIICARTKSSIDLVKKNLDLLKHKNQKLYGVVTDISNSKDVEDLYNKAKSELGNIDILINNAAVIEPPNKFLECDFTEWKKSFDINFFGSVLMIKKFLQDMVKNGFGKVIQLSGGGAASPLEGMTSYASSKVAIVRFLESISKEYLDSGVDFNSVAPGMMRTRLLQQMVDAGPDVIGPALHDKSKDLVNSASDSSLLACKLILFLCSERSRGISGKLISAQWDNWQTWPEHIRELVNSDVFTLRRITGKDRNFHWGDL